MPTAPRSAPCLLAIAASLLGGCGKKVPIETQPSLDAVRADARLVAEAAAKACAANYAKGRFEVTSGGCAVRKLPGEEIVPMDPSPAKGSALEARVDVIQVQASCSAPVPGKKGEACGLGLGELRRGATPRAIPGRMRDLADSNCRSSPQDCEEVVVPSQVEADPKSVDLRVIKPVLGGPAGATAEITVTILKK